MPTAGDRPRHLIPSAYDVTAKLEAVRRAADHRFPTADIDEMLAESERGYACDVPPA
jgi:hypothetical protein